MPKMRIGVVRDITNVTQHIMPPNPITAHSPRQARLMHTSKIHEGMAKARMRQSNVFVNQGDTGLAKQSMRSATKSFNKSDAYSRAARGISRPRGKSKLGY